MFNFTTTTVVNNGQVIRHIPANGSHFAKLQVNRYPELFHDPAGVGPHIVDVKINRATKAEFAEANVDISGLSDNEKYRIDIYIRIQGNNESTYANDWVFKGKPLSLGEFIRDSSKDGNAANNKLDQVDEIIKNIKTLMLTIYGETLVNVTKVSATQLNIKAKTQYQRFIDQDNNAGVKVMHISKVANAFDQKFVGTGITDFGASIVGDYAAEEIAGAVTMVATGKEAFGDFAHIVKDLRLPTGPNTRWYGPAIGDWTMDEANDDKPNPGSYYTQFTITYEADRGVMGLGVVGGLAKSRTTHVFYVKDKPLTLTSGQTSAQTIAPSTVPAGTVANPGATEAQIGNDTAAQVFVKRLEDILGAPIAATDYVPVPTSVL